MPLPIPTLLISGHPRRLAWMSKFVDAEPLLANAGSADSVHTTVSRLQRESIRVVLLDVDHPELETLQRELRAWDRRMPVVLVRFGSTTAGRKGVMIPDPEGTPVAGAAGTRLLEVVRRALSERDGRVQPQADIYASPPVEPRRRDSTIQIVAIGSSNGGPAALTEVLAPLRATFPVPIVVAQHLPPQLTASFVEQLNSQTALTVMVAYEDQELSAGKVYIAPPDRHLRVVRARAAVRAQLDAGPPINCCRPSVDALFESVANVFQQRALALVLTGMGNDGTEGCRQIASERGIVLVQDEASSVAWGMPGSVYEQGLAHEVIALPRLAEAIARRCGVQVSSRTPKPDTA